MEIRIRIKKRQLASLEIFRQFHAAIRIISVRSSTKYFITACYFRLGYTRECSDICLLFDTIDGPLIPTILHQCPHKLDKTNYLFLGPTLQTIAEVLLKNLLVLHGRAIHHAWRGRRCKEYRPIFNWNQSGQFRVMPAFITCHYYSS